MICYDVISEAGHSTWSPLFCQQVIFYICLPPLTFASDQPNLIGIKNMVKDITFNTAYLSSLTFFT